MVKLDAPPDAHPRQLVLRKATMKRSQTLLVEGWLRASCPTMPLFSGAEFCKQPRGKSKYF